ncbi:putative cytochrome c oxidase subunit 7A1, mitochondrial [Apostichopus japonicus]|uniref:Putative cytochrome c oxidase subunit 7A1, mitochondrial n=1 Tax=Stichopus japonicus TaxID=307972 RepID=A0A2G8KDF4_STIJA|nr:putative cytochrome c oxidase subunit 7A1, mitochondrial [Apostichopus japonicus]
MNSVSVIRCLVPRASRTFSTSIRSQVENKVKNQQLRFQESDGQPVHLKGGGKDRMIYLGVVLITGAGTLWACADLLNMSIKK